jgi:hypothetical protein
MHRSATGLEAQVCTELAREKVDHEHRSLRFRVRDAEDRDAPFAPAIVARRGSILFLVEPVSAADEDAFARFARFLAQHSPEIVFVLVAKDDLLVDIPAEAYDEIYAASNVAGLARRIAGQDPDGIVQPFGKPGPR